MKVGVVGAGRMGAERARVFADSHDFELVAVQDASRERALAVAGRYGGRAADDLDDLLASVGAVVVAIPASEHHAVASRALEAGCHVLVEKPLAAKLGDARELCSAARKRGLVLGVGHAERFNGSITAALQVFTPASPRYFEGKRLARFQARGTDVSVIFDLMIHDIDLVCFLSGSPVEEALAVGTPLVTEGVDMANARLRLADGSVANLTASRVSSRNMREMRVFQPTGYFSLNLARQDGVYRPREGRKVDLKQPPGEPLAREMEAFAAALAGRPSLMATGEEGVRSLEIATAITEEIERFRSVAYQDS